VVRWLEPIASLALLTPLNLAFVHFPGRIARLDGARTGTAPSEFLFGAVELERNGHAVVHYEVDPKARVGRLTARTIDRWTGLGYLPPHLTGAVLRGTRSLLPSLRDADAVVATTTPTAIGLALWRRVGLLRRPVVGIVSGIVNQPWRRTRRLTTLPLLRQMHLALYGGGELNPLLAVDSRLVERLHVVGFGVDTRFWTPDADPVSDEVFAIGNDGARDWNTLVRAAHDIPATVRILTRSAPPRTLPGNVLWGEADWHGQLLSDGEVRDLYRRARAVVVPVRDVPQPSGQSVTLQAMACGRPVVLTRTRGLWDENMLRDGGNVVLVPPGDSAALANAVCQLISIPERATEIGRQAREDVARDAGVEVFAERLERVCRVALQQP